MPKPKNAPNIYGHSKVMFVNEGNPVAMLLVNKSGHRNFGAMKMPTAIAALAWCRTNGAVLVYLPFNADQN